MEAADARAIPRPDASADAVLLMGPLYHITERGERLAALREAKRLLRPGGVIFAAAITPYATLLWATTVFGRGNGLLMEPAFMEMAARELRDGQHIPGPASNDRGMPRAFFHRPEQLAAEFAEAGFAPPDVRGVVGPAWLAPDLDAQWSDPARREALLRTVRLTEREGPLMGLHTHLLAVAQA
jgi:SAM-dependent methyltransferase